SYSLIGGHTAMFGSKNAFSKHRQPGACPAHDNLAGRKRCVDQGPNVSASPAAHIIGLIAADNENCLCLLHLLSYEPIIGHRMGQGIYGICWRILSIVVKRNSLKGIDRDVCCICPASEDCIVPIVFGVIGT